MTDEAKVPQTQHPKKAKGVLETVYSRLRNELAHNRGVARREAMGAEVGVWLPRLAELVRKAIQANP